MSKINDIKLFLAQFLPGLVTSVAGLSIMLVLLVYRDIIALGIFPQLTQSQATLVIFSLIGFTFFIAIIGTYAWLATRKGIQFKQVLVFLILIFAIFSFTTVGIYAWFATREGIQLQQVLIFGGLILILLSVIVTAIYWVTRYDKASHNESKEEPTEKSEPEPPSPWYLKAMAALESSNHAIALEYVNRGLQKAPKPVASLVVLKIKLLLLMGGKENRTTAQNIAEQHYGDSPVLARWIDCLKQQRQFSSLLTTETELETRCPSPNHRQCH